MTNVALLEKCNEEWKALLISKDLKGDSKVAEEKEYAWAAEGEGGIVELLLDTREIMGRLQARLNRVLRSRERSGRRPLPNTSQDESRSKQGPNPQMKLPKLDLPTFNGDLLSWQEYWDIFSSSIHQQAGISDVVKFSYLKSSLRGAAASAISGISVTNDNYAIVIALLKEKFGRKEAIVEALYSQLQILPIAQNRFSEVKSTYDAIEKILRQLESQNEDIDRQRIIVQQILLKFPMDVVIKLEESKVLNESWTVTSLREALKRYITIHSNAYRYEAISKPHHLKGNRSPQSRITSLEPPTDRQLSAEALVANSQRGSSRYTHNKGEPTKPCVFCEGTHFNDCCNKFSTVESRKGQLSNQGRCFICFKSGHVCKHCPSAKLKSCYYCNRVGHHHRSICPQRFDVSNRNDVIPASVNVSSETDKQLLDDSKSGQEGEMSSTPLTSNVNFSHALLASGEKVLLQTAMVTVSGDDGSKASVRLLLDSASQRTFFEFVFSVK